LIINLSKQIKGEATLFRNEWTVLKLFLEDMNMAKSKILIVEDEYITALDLKTQLMSKGQFGFDLVDSGEEAVNLA